MDVHLPRRTALGGALLCLVVLAVAGQAGAAAAGGPGVWTRVTDVTSSSTEDLGLARGTDGVLHVVWLRTSPGTSYVDTKVSSTGAVSTPQVISSGWFGAADPDAVAGPHGLAAFWNGIRTSSGSPHGTFRASRPLSGGSWTTGAQPVAQGTSVGDSADTTAAVGTDGAFWTAYTGTSVAQVTRTGSPGHNVSPKACCPYDPGLGVDGSTGDVWLGYFDNGTGTSGTLVQRFAKTSGAPVGTRLRLPSSADSAGNAIEPDQRVAITGRGTGKEGVYAAYGSGYPTTDRVRLWHSGSTGSTVLASTGGSTSVGRIALTPDGVGGLWLLWSTSGGGVQKLFVRHSDKTVTTWSAARQVPLPSGTSAVYKLFASGTASRVDVVARLDHAFAGTVAAYATQVSATP